MTQINDVSAAIGALPSGDKLLYRQAAIQFKVDRSTLRLLGADPEGSCQK
jgi:hypothetical protein